MQGFQRVQITNDPPSKWEVDALQSEIQRADNAAAPVVQFQQINTAPTRTLDGEVRYADGVNWDPLGTATAGFVWFNGTAWQALGGGSPFAGDIIVANSTDQIVFGNGASSGFTDPAGGEDIVWIGTIPTVLDSGSYTYGVTLTGQFAGENILDGTDNRDSAAIYGAYAMRWPSASPNEGDCAFGYGAAQGSNSAHTGPSGEYFGYYAGGNASGGQYNSGFGYKTFYALTTGERNTGFGREVGTAITTGTDNDLSGWHAGIALTTGIKNTAHGSGVFIAATTAHDNDIGGYGAAVAMTTGYNNVVHGSGAGVVITTGHDNVVIGKGADVAAAGNTNSVVIGSGMTGTGTGTIALGGSATGARFVYGTGVGTGNNWGFYFPDDSGAVLALAMLSGGTDSGKGYLAINTNDAPVSGSAVGLRAKSPSAAAVDLFLYPENGGVVGFGTHTGIGVELVTGYITIKDAAGTSRKLAVVS